MTGELSATTAKRRKMRRRRKRRRKKRRKRRRLLSQPVERFWNPAGSNEVDLNRVSCNARSSVF